MKALTHNINYLAIVHRKEKAHFMIIDERSDSVQKMNDHLDIKCKKMSEVLAVYEQDKSLHASRAKELEKLNDEHAKNKLKMGDQKSMIEELNEKITKLDIDVQVVTAEKITYKKENDRLQSEKTHMAMEFKALREANNLNMDEIEI